MTRREHIHGGDRGSWTRVGREGRESSGRALIASIESPRQRYEKTTTHSLFDISMGQARREMRHALGLGRGRDDLRAVDEVALGMAEDGHLAERSLERGSHELLVAREGLPEAVRGRVSREEVVGLEADLAVERGHHLALVRAVAREERAAHLHLDEDLRVEDSRSRVEGSAGDGRVDVVRSGDGVRCEERDDLCRRKATRVIEAGKDVLDGVERLRNGEIGGGLRRILTADEDVQLRGTRAVADTDRASKLDATGRVRKCDKFRAV